MGRGADRPAPRRCLRRPASPPCGRSRRLRPLFFPASVGRHARNQRSLPGSSQAREFWQGLLGSRAGQRRVRSLPQAGPRAVQFAEGKPPAPLSQRHRDGLRSSLRLHRDVPDGGLRMRAAKASRLHRVGPHGGRSARGPPLRGPNPDPRLSLLALQGQQGAARLRRAYRDRCFPRYPRGLHGSGRAAGAVDRSSYDLGRRRLPAHRADLDR